MPESTISRDRIVAAALELLSRDGLAGFSMRRLAEQLEVRVNTIYWHVPNKQELLALVGAEIVADAGEAAGSDARSIALDFRARMLAVRDGAEIVALARAKHPRGLEPSARLAVALMPMLGDNAAEAAEAIAQFVVGATIEEQNRHELVQVDAEAAAETDLDRHAVVERGLDLLLAGIITSRPATDSR